MDVSPSPPQAPLMWEIVKLLFAAFVGSILGFVGGITLRLMTDKQLCWLRLKLGFVKPNYSLKLGQARVFPLARTLVSGTIKQYASFYDVRAENEEVPGDNVYLEIIEFTDQQTFMPLPGILALDPKKSNNKMRATRAEPRTTFYEMIEKGNGVLVGCVGTKRYRMSHDDAFLSYKFTCSRVTIGKGELKIP
ncbi:MAG: hypothetical protein HY913_16635 [Desulfomonile tiedjei]|nr:hypothetical protein [Desulfomonile tiedjei]